MKPFLTNKGCLDNSDIMLRGDDEMITDDKLLAKLFNEHYINIIERSSGLKPEKLSVTMKTLIRKWSYITLSKSMKIILV